MSSDKIMINKYGEINEVTLMDSRILDETVIGQLGEALNTIADEMEKPNIILNFEHVNYLSSAVLGKLVALRKRVVEGKGRVVLCGLKPDIFEIFKITQLNKVFEIYGDSSKALASYQGRIIK
jgi:anti-sigma B factor antagonist